MFFTDNGMHRTKYSLTGTHKTFPIHYGLKEEVLLYLCSIKYTVGKKSIRALEIVLAIFLCFECQFLSFYACYKEYKA